ncbi:MAG TPA: putative PEP-binding protein, partial [Xanthobacteraceae bacterium]
ARFDELSIPMLRALRHIAAKGRAHAKPVAVCGELASRPIGALALTAIGYRSLSLAPSAIGPVKAMLLDVDAAKVAALMEPLLEGPAGGVSVRDKLKEFAAVSGLQL